MGTKTQAVLEANLHFPLFAERKSLKPMKEETR